MMPTSATLTMHHPAPPGPDGHLLHPIVRKLSTYAPLDAEEQAVLAGLSVGGQRVDGRFDLLVEGAAPDLAVLDLPLRDGDGRRLARVLRASGVPFLVHAADARDATACAELSAAPRLIKPAWHRDLVLVLGQLAREARP